MSEKFTPPTQAEKVLRATLETLQELRSLLQEQIVQEGHATEEDAQNFLAGKTFDELDKVSQLLEAGHNPLEQPGS